MHKHITKDVSVQKIVWKNKHWKIRQQTPQSSAIIQKGYVMGKKWRLSKRMRHLWLSKKNVDMKMYTAEQLHNLPAWR